MKKLILTTVALALSASFAIAETVRMGTEGAYPPYNFINDEGEVDGFERQLGDELCTRAKLTCEWVVNDWDSIIPNLVSGNYDTIIAGMSNTAERDNVIDFTEEYLPAPPSAYVGLAADANISGGIIAAQNNTVEAGFLASKEGVTLVEFVTPEETIAAVRNGEADAVLADKSYLDPIVAESGGKLVFVGDDALIAGGISMGIRDSNGELREQFNAAIKSMKADGTLNTMIAKWFGEDAAAF